MVPTRAPSTTAGPGPDVSYALVAGLYVGLLLTPGVVAGLARVTDDAGVLYVGFLVSVAVLAGVAGWAVRRVPGLAVGLGRTDAVWGLTALPVVWSVGVFGTLSLATGLPTATVPAVLVGVAGGTLLGLVLVVMSRNRHASVALEGTTDLVTWEARWPERWRRFATVVLVVTFGLAAAGFLASFVFGREWGWSLYNAMFLGVPFMNLLNTRTFRATDAGLLVGYPGARRFRPWSEYDGVEGSRRSLVVRSAAPWRPAHRCDTADIDDVGAVVTALEDRIRPGGRTPTT